MNVARPCKGVAVAALTSIGAALALAGPMAGDALAARPSPSVQPAITSATPPNPSSLTSVAFAWTTVSAAHPSGVAESFTCFLDGAKANCGNGVSGSTSYSNLSQGTHSFFVKGKQPGHPRSVNSSAVTWRVDLTAPAAPNVQPVTPNPTRNTSVDITFSAADTDTASFVCALDDVDPAHATACTTSGSYQATGLSPGSHTLYVYALDSAQPTPNESAAAATAWTVDVTAPGSPVFTSQPVATTNSTSASFAWTDDPTATTSACSLDNATFSACSQSSSLPGAISYSNLAEGPHTLVVRDADAASNTSTALASWNVDLTPPPAPKIVSGPATSTDQTSATFAFEDADQTATFLCQVTDGGTTLVPNGACTSPFTLPSLTDGTYTFSVQAKDTAGNVGPATPYSWTIDTSDTSPVQLSPITYLTAPAAFSNVTHPTFTWVGLDDLTTEFVCALDSNVFTDCGSPDANGDGAYTVPAGVTLTQSGHVLAVKATDGSGDTSPATVYAWTFDQTPPPAPVFSTTPGQPSNSTSGVFSFASEPNAQFTCSLDGAAATLCASPVTFSGLSVGDHTFVVRAEDAAGNTSLSSFPWTIDLSAPSAPAITGPTGIVASSAAHFAWTDDDGSVTGFTCALDGGTASSCTSPQDMTGLSDGPHRLAVTASNAAKSATSSDTWTIDTTKPVLHLTGVPANGALINTTTVSPTITQTEANPGTASCLLSGPSANAACGPYVGLADGAYTLTVNTTDAAGNAADPVTTGWTVDSTPPAAPTISGPASTSDPRPTFSFSDTDSVAGFVCAVDSGAFTACTSPIHVPGPLAVGSHTLVVRAVDAVGNSRDSAPFAFTVSATAPGSGTSDPAPTATWATPTTLTGSAVATFSETVHALSTGSTSLVLTGTSTVVPTNLICLSGSAAVGCGGSFTALRLTPRSVLTPGQHYTVQEASGAAQDSGGNPSVASASAFRGSLSEQETSAAAHATWATAKATAAYGHSFVAESARGAAASYIFKGTNVTWWTVTGPDQGKATVFIDGVRKAYVDNYATATHYKVGRHYGKLANKVHTLRIVVRGLKGAKAGTGTLVAVDALSVGSGRANTPALTTTWRSLTGTRYSASRAATASHRGDALSFTFRGTSVTWVTQRGVNQGKVAVYVDGVRRATFDDFATSTSYGVKRLVSGLTDALHTVKLVVLGTHHKGAKGSFVTVDRFLVG